MLIDADAKPIRNVPVYKRVSDRKPVITSLELCQSGDRAPDLALYWFDVRRDVYLLKEVHPEPAPLRVPLALSPAVAPNMLWSDVETLKPTLWQKWASQSAKLSDAAVEKNNVLLEKLKLAAQQSEPRQAHVNQWLAAQSQQQKIGRMI